MKIQMREPNGPYSCTVDTEVMDVRITKAFKGAMFVSEDGEMLTVSMRDSGFEVQYYGSHEADGFNAGTTSFQNGVVTTAVEKTSEDNEESNFVKHAKRELEILGVDEEPMIKSLLGAVEAFASYGHSGGSHSWALAILAELLQFNALSPLTDDPNEWNNVGDGVWQNSRQSEAFSNDGGKTYYLLSELKKGEDAAMHTSVEKEVLTAANAEYDKGEQ